MSDASVLFGGGAVPLWVSGTTYAQGRVTISPTDWQTYVRKVAGAGSTDPASDATNWVPCGGRAIKSTQRGLTAVATANVYVAIAAVNPAKTELRFLGSTSNTADTTGLGSVSLFSPSLILVSKGASAVTETEVSWELTERY